MNRTKLLATSVACVAVLGAAGAVEAQVRAQQTTASDSAAAVRTVERFHAALAAGDSASAAALLDTGVVVLESGDLETRSDYLRHHLPADIVFARAVGGTRAVRQVKVSGDAAWVVSTSRATGIFEGRAVDSDGAELMLLTRSGAGWRIAAIHWSSHRRTPPAAPR